MAEIVIAKNPLIEHSLGIMRDQNTGIETFRHHARIVSQLVFAETAKTFRTKEKSVQTPLACATIKELDENLIFVPILRAGLAMLTALDDFIPSAPTGFIGLKRDEQTAIASQYYENLPKINARHHIILLDPMLATGGSKERAIALLKNRGAKKITAVSIVAAPEGIRKVQVSHPDVTIFTAAIDSHLDSRKYIVPGLGDFGDRYFGT